MRFLFVILMFLITSSSIDAYEKQIVLDKFKDKASAQIAFHKFQNDKLYKLFNPLARGNGLKMHICHFNNDNILLVKPIENEYILEAVMDIVKLKFEEAYSEEITLCEEVSPSIKTTKKVKKNIKYKRIYQQKIVFSTFGVEKNAKNELKRFQSTKIYKKLDTLAVDNNFTVYTRPLGKYTALVAEPIINPTVYKEVMALLRKRYKHAYGVDDSIVVKSEILKPIVEKVDVSEPIPEVKKVEENTTLENQEENATSENQEVLPQEENTTATPIVEVEKFKEEILESNQSIENVEPAEVVETIIKTDATDVKNEEQEESDSGYFSWWYIFFIAVFIGLYKLYKKYKPIYDEY